MSRSIEICNQLLSLAEQCKIPYGGGVTAQILTNAVREIRRLNEQLAFADNQAEKLEALLEPHVAWDGQPTEIERLRAKLAEADRRNQELNREMSGVRRSYRDAHKARLKLARQLDAAEAVIAPFVDFINAAGECFPDHAKMIHEPSSIWITGEQFRAAAEWMEKGDE